MGNPIHLTTRLCDMPSSQPRAVSLRRSCQACVRAKRRCDQRVLKCSRCVSKGLDCKYINEPLLVSNAIRNTGQQIIRGTSRPQVHASLRLEIAKEYDQAVIQFLLDGLRMFPETFALSRKTLFIHPDLYISGTPAPIREFQDLCHIHVREKQRGQTVNLKPLLWHKSINLHRDFIHAASFEESLACAQALLLSLCILALDDGPIQYSDGISAMLDGIANRLWQQAPIQLPSKLSRRHAWLLAESVRRTIIVSLMLRSAYSLKTRNYSVRTPFVDALPFDMRTNLWDEISAAAWEDSDDKSQTPMVSLHEYSDALERGQIHDVNPFGALILAACKGKRVSAIPFPPLNGYF